MGTLRRPLCPFIRETERRYPEVYKTPRDYNQNNQRQNTLPPIPFEAVSQTEFLSFDQLSQSAHIYLVGEAGIPPSKWQCPLTTSPMSTCTPPPARLQDQQHLPQTTVPGSELTFPQSLSDEAIRLPFLLVFLFVCLFVF